MPRYIKRSKKINPEQSQAALLQYLASASSSLCGSTYLCCARCASVLFDTPAFGLPPHVGSTRPCCACFARAFFDTAVLGSLTHHVFDTAGFGSRCLRVIQYISGGLTKCRSTCQQWARCVVRHVGGGLTVLFDMGSLCLRVVRHVGVGPTSPSAASRWRRLSQLGVAMALFWVISLSSGLVLLIVGFFVWW